MPAKTVKKPTTKKPEGRYFEEKSSEEPKTGTKRPIPKDDHEEEEEIEALGMIEKRPKGLMVEAKEAQLAKKLFGLTNVLGSDTDDSDDEAVDEDDVVVQTVSSNAIWRDEDDDAEELVLPGEKSRAGRFLKRSTDEGNTVNAREYENRLRTAFQRSQNAGKVPTWANIGKKSVISSKLDDSDDEVEQVLNELTRTTGSYVTKDDQLPKGVLQAHMMQDITVGHSDKKPLRILRFHPTKSVLVTAGEQGRINLYQVDDDVKKEHWIQSVNLVKFPVTSMDFVEGSEEVICGSTRQEYFMKYNLTTGSVTQFRLPQGIPKQNTGTFTVSSDGSLLVLAGHSAQIHVMSVKSMELVQSLAAPSPVISLSFVPGTTTEVWALTERGQVLIWNFSRQTLHTFTDEGAVKGTFIRMSHDGQYVATGSNTGVVNVYDCCDARTSTSPKPLVTMTGLLTSCNAIAFTKDCQAMAAASNVKKNMMKVMRMRSQTLFQNFPLKTDVVGHIESLEFSPGGAYLATGATSGELRIFRLSNYSGY